MKVGMSGVCAGGDIFGDFRHFGGFGGGKGLGKGFLTDFVLPSLFYLEIKLERYKGFLTLLEVCGGQVQRLLG
jgi:hypothetical protein